MLSRPLNLEYRIAEGMPVHSVDYVTLGFSADEAGHQLGHKDGSQILQTYGHGFHGALERLPRGTAVKAATKLPLAAAEEAS
jgi:hypothetical protein